MEGVSLLCIGINLWTIFPFASSFLGTTFLFSSNLLTLRCFRLGGQNITFKLVFVFHLDQGSPRKQIVLQTWDHLSLTSWLPHYFLKKHNIYFEFSLFGKYFWVFFGYFWEFHTGDGNLKMHIHTSKILLIISGITRIPGVHTHILNLNMYIPNTPEIHC